MIGNRAVTDIEIERFVLGELGADRVVEIEKLRTDDPVLNARIAAVTASDREILEAYPPRQFVAAIREAAASQNAPKKRPVWIALPALGAAAAALALTLAFLPKPEKTGASSTGASNTDNSFEQIRLKGPDTPTLFVIRKSASGEESLRSGQSAAAGDVVQLKYAAKGASYGVIFSIDGRGTVTLHYPSNDLAEPVLERRGAHALDFSYELDDAPAFERFFFVTANHPFDPKTVIEKAKAENPGERGALSLDPTLSQCDFVLKKSR